MAAQSLPVVLDGGGAPLAEWWRAYEAETRVALADTGAVVLRGFDITDVQRFDQARALLLRSPGTYVEGATPRQRLDDHVYTSTEFPATETIAMHNENSYATTWPGKLLFGCLREPESGGATPVADVRKVLVRLDPALVREFENRGGWLLRRTYGEWFGLGWQRAFGTTERSAVDAYCADSDVATTWSADGVLRTSQVRPVTVVHPDTHQRVWFNHVHFWHASSMATETRELLEEEFGPDCLPYSTHYADGSPVPDEVVEQIREAFDAETAAEEWRRGDLMLVDNMLAAHGRQAYTGLRRIVVAMGEPVTRVSCGS